MTAKPGYRKWTRPWGRLAVSLIFCMACVALTSGSALAQGSIYGTVQNSDATTPGASDVLWWGFLDDTDEEIRIESNTGAGFDGANWWDDFQNYTTEAPGNPYDYHFQNLVNGEAFHLAKTIPNNSAQQEDIILAPAANPAQPAGLAAGALSSTNILVQWNGVSGITYHVYRRHTSNNGVFRRIDDPTGSLSNAGVADSFFVDATSDGISNYTYIIIGEDASGNYSAHSVEVSTDAATDIVPTIATVDPNTGPTVGGTAITITGTNFDPDGVTVTIGGAAATSVTVVSPFEITCVTPSGSGSADVVVTNIASGQVSSPLVDGFTYFVNNPPVADAGPDQLGIDAGTLVTLDGTGSSDLDGDSLSHSWLQVAGPSVTLSSNTVAQPTFTPTVRGSYEFELTVNDGIIDSDPDTVLVTVNNQTPSLASIGSQSVDEGQNLNFGVSASDPDGDSLILSAENVPTNATFTDNFDGTGTFDFNPDYTQAGNYTVRFIASDGDLADTQEVPITVNQVNLPPELTVPPAQVVNEGENLNFSVSASDPDGTTPTITAENVPTNATFNSPGDGTGTFDFNPDYTQSGSYSVRFIADDGALADTQYVDITVNDAGNQAPVLATIGAQSVTEGENLNVPVSATDDDLDSLILSAENLPVNATFTDNYDGTGVFDFNPDYTQAGVYTVTFIASDGALADTEFVDITVNEAGNQAPVLATIGAQSVTEGENLNVPVSATDDDLDSLILSAENLPVNATFTDNYDGTGVFDFNPDYTQAGVYTVTFIASDGALADTEFVDITVNEAGNQAPVLATIGAQSVTEGENLNVPVSATDDDLDSLILSAENLPVNATFTDNYDGTGVFDFNPDYTQAGVYTVTFIASDGALADTEFVDITVNEAGNQAPVISVPGAQTVLEGENLTFGVSATDADSTTPGLRAENVPVRASFVDNGDGTGTFTFDPDFTQSGLYTVTFIADDGLLEDTATVDISVIEAENQTPVITVPSAQTVTEGFNLNFSVSATDADSTIPALIAEDVPANATFTDNGDGTGTFDFNPDFTQAGLYTVRFIADDGLAADTGLVDITVNDAGNQAPVITVPSAQTVDEGVNLNFTVSASDADNDSLILTAENVPVRATFTDNGDGTGTFDFHPDFTQAGVYTVTFIADDGALADTGFVEITVQEVGNQRPSVVVPGAQSVTEGLSLVFDITGTDPDSTIPALTAENVPTNAGFTDNFDGTGTFTFDPDYTQAGLYTVTFIANDGALADTDYVDITVTEAGNQAPVLSAIGAQSVPEGQNLNLLITAADADLDSLIFSAEDVPLNATFADNFDGTATFDFNPDFTQSGLYTVRFIVSDGAAADTELVDITVTEQNQPPTVDPIAAQSVDEAQVLSVPISASDPDGDSLILSGGNLPLNATVVDNFDGTGLLNFSPDYDQAGLYTVEVIASDGFDADTALVDITVNDVNRPPAYTAIASQSVIEGENLNFTREATDPDGDSVILSAENLPANATYTDNFDGTAVFDFNPDFTQSGTYDVTFIASDGSLADTDVVSITVTEPGNQPPVWDPVSAQTVNEGSTLEILVHVTDPEGGVLDINYITSLPTFAFTDSGNGYATWEYHPDYYAAGVDTVRFVATDDGVPETSSFLDVQITIDDVNQPPILVPIGPQSVLAGDSIALRIVATDSTADAGNVLFMTASNVPINASFVDSGNGIAGFVFKPEFDQIGLHQVTFRVTDNGTPAYSDNEVVDFDVVSQNRAPVLASIGPKQVNEGDSIGFRISATDPDGTIPSLSVQTALEGYTFADSGNGAGFFSYVADYVSSGLHELKFIASDGIATDKETVILQVVEAGNQVPVLAPIGPISVTEGDEIGVFLSASDLENDSLIFIVDPILANSQLTDNGDGTALYEIAPQFWQDSVYNLTFSVFDGEDADTEIVELTIVDAGNQLPQFDPVDPISVAELDTIQFRVFAADPDSVVPVLSAPTLPGSATFADSGGGVGGFFWETTYADSGTYQIEIIATDGEFSAESQSLFVDVTVTDVNRSPLFSDFPIQPQAVDENQTIVISATAVDPDGPAPVMSVRPVLDNMSFVDNDDGTIDLTFSPYWDQAGNYELEWVAVDRFYDTDSVFQTLQITVNNVNAPPMFDPYTPPSVMEGDTLDYTLTATDPDGTLPAMLALNLPANATYTDNGDGSGTLVFAPNFTQAGVYDVIFIASDGPNLDQDTIPVTVVEAGEAPVVQTISDQSVLEGENLNFVVTASDGDGDSLVLSAEGLPLFATFTDNYDGTGVFDFSPNYQQAGAYTVEFIAFDGFLADTESVVITVQEAGNQPPVISPIADQSVTEGGDVIAPITVSDPDGTINNIYGENLPANANVANYNNNTGALTFNPDYTQAGVYTVSIIADDGALADTEFVEITVTEAGDQVPQFTAVPPDTQLISGDTFQFRVLAEDPDGLPVTLTALDLPVNASFADSGGGVGGFEFTPDLSQGGLDFPIRFIVDDGTLSDTTTVTFSVVAYIVGDCNNDWEISPIDVIWLANFVYQQDAPAPIPVPEAGDCDCDGSINPLDVQILAGHVYKGWPPPPESCP